MKFVRFIFMEIVIAILSVFANAFPQGGELFVKPLSENIRLGPNGQIIGVILSGTEVEVLERQTNWIKVQMTGWIRETALVADKSEIAAFYIRASHILLSTAAEAQKVLDQIKAGADFEEMANSHSIDRQSGEVGGDLGRFRRGDFSEAIENAAFKLKIGELSGVVKSDLGFHIIKRTE